MIKKLQIEFQKKKKIIILKFAPHIMKKQLQISLIKVLLLLIETINIHCLLRKL
jgi:hypothetical protein